MKPLNDTAPHDLSSYAEPIGRLVDLPGAPGYQQTVDFFEGYPELSLTSPGSRAFLYLATKALRPRFVLEIGTYYAGTTEALARGVAANGFGHMMTIDPYGAERVPAILEGWPSELRDVTTFGAIDSMGLFTRLEQLRSAIDLVFVDGNHEYGFALYDLNMSAKWLSPSGIIVVDDYLEPSVYTATRDFLATHPGWRALGHVFEQFDPADPFVSMGRPSVQNTNFLVLVRPPNMEVRDRSVYFTYGPFPDAGVRGFAIDPMPGSIGTLHARVILRSFDDVAGNQQINADVSSELQGEGGVVDILLDRPSVTSHDLNRSSRVIEVVLFWEGSDNKSALQLNGEPNPILFQGA